MAVSDQYSRGVPMPRAILLGRLDEALDLAIGEIFTAALANCYIYAVGAAPRSRDEACNRPGWMFKPRAADSGNQCPLLGGKADIPSTCLDVRF